MLKFNKTAPDAQTATEPIRQGRPEDTRLQASRKVTPSVRPDAAPLPEVTEGNEDSDWALWEDSVAFQDSQMPSSFGSLESAKERDEPREDEDIDPFATVRRRGA